MDQTSMPVEQRERCAEFKQDGTQCTRKARAGERTCRQHSDRGTPRSPTAITAAEQKEFFDFLEQGVPRDRAIAAVGISRSTVYHWLARADDPSASDEYRAFAAGVERAEARWEAVLVGNIHEAAKTDHRAAAWLLERRAPERYSRPSVRPSGQIKLPVGGRDDEEDETGDVAGEDNVVPIRRTVDGDADW